MKTKQWGRRVVGAADAPEMRAHTYVVLHYPRGIQRHDDERLVDQLDNTPLPVREHVCGLDLLRLALRWTMRLRRHRRLPVLRQHGEMSNGQPMLPLV